MRSAEEGERKGHVLCPGCRLATGPHRQVQALCCTLHVRVRCMYKCAVSVYHTCMPERTTLVEIWSC